MRAAAGRMHVRHWDAVVAAWARAFPVAQAAQRGFRAPRVAVAMLLCSILLAGCSIGEGDLNEWLAQKRREVKPGVQPLQPPSRFEPQSYAGQDRLDPFSPRKLVSGVRNEIKQVNPLTSAELNRRREPLEAFPLDAISMVGSMIGHNDAHALITVNRLLYKVRVGDYMGQNYGRITAIEENSIRLREIVQDAAGEWVQRESILRLAGDSR
jgi:type IV pilus assembly protein PilP